MKIELTTKEYRDLLDILHIADVIMSGHRREQDRRVQTHRALVQKLYALAGEEGLDRLIEYNQTAKKYSPTMEFEQDTVAHAMVHEFGEHLFWDELINRLSLRDAARSTGTAGPFGPLGDSERLTAEKIRQRYIEEFSAFGVDNLELVDPDASPAAPLATSD